uniref:Uncharacterized protein n=1 Tax=Setaria italica TaxID=4555 RepID=K3Y1G7_SETIT
MGELYGSIVHCPYIEGDAKNLRVEYRAENKGKDMKATLDYFEELKKEDPDFYYNYTLDDEDRQELSDDFKDCLDNSFLPSEFEGKWQVFLDKHGLNDDEIQASRYVNPKNSIYNSIQQYRKIQWRIFGKQDLQEANTVTKVPHYLTGHPMERQIKKVYTRKLFNLFLYELQLLYYGVLCCHVMKVFDTLAVREVPEQYILPRWSTETFHGQQRGLR